MEGWKWIALGLALVIAELLAPTGFFLFILGIACLVVGALVYFGIVAGWIFQVLIFSSTALVVWYVFPDKLQSLLRSKEKEYRGLLGQVAKSSEVIAPGNKGAGELWGSPWRLENVGDSILQPGDECEVLSSDGLVLKVKRKG